MLDVVEMLMGARLKLASLIARVDGTIALVQSVRDHSGALWLVAHGRSISRCPTCGAYMHDGAALSKGFG